MKIEKRHYHRRQWNQALPKDLDSPNTLILMFYDGQQDWTPAISELQNTFPLSTLVGGSSAGEIFDTLVFDESLSCVILKFEKTQFQTLNLALTTPDESFQVGEQLAQKLYRPDLRGIFVLSDGLGVNGTELTAGINANLSHYQQNISVSGGLMADGARFQSTSTWFQGKFHTHHVIAIAFYGQAIQFSTGFFGGWETFGPERQVTRSQGNILFEIDGKPALALYKEYLGHEAANLPASALLFPLLLKQQKKVDLVRTILAIDEPQQSLTFAGDIPEGAIVQLMRAQLSRLVDGASEAGRISSQGFPAQATGPIAALAVSCVGRRLVLGQKTDDELEALAQVLPDQTQLIGFYSYGELSANGFSTCELHNQTMTVTLIREAA